MGFKWARTHSHAHTHAQKLTEIKREYSRIALALLRVRVRLTAISQQAMIYYARLCVAWRPNERQRRNYMRAESNVRVCD